MNNFKTVFFSLIILIIFQGCSAILEPVFLDQTKKDLKEIEQEEFNININTLTFKKSIESNKDAYPRQLMITGSGARANVYNEGDFLTKDIPNYLTNSEYRLGQGDELSLLLINQFKNEVIKWPNSLAKTNYILGVGDVLTLVQSADLINPVIALKEMTNNRVNDEENILSVNGVVGSNGNILLLGLGSLKAVDRTLEDVRAEIRNILIRNGSAPNFQLEITEFNSKKAYVTNNKNQSRIIGINTIPVSLREVAYGSGLSKTNENSVLITLVRNKQTYKFTAGQLFNINSPDTFIQDKDHIHFEITEIPSSNVSALVGSNGDILLPGIGKLVVENRTLADVHEEITTILTMKGKKPDIQLEITKFRNKKLYFSNRNQGNKILYLSNEENTLRQVVHLSSAISEPKDGLAIIILTRGKRIFRLALDRVLDPNTPNIWIQNDDQIEINYMSYKDGQVYILTGSGDARIMSINPSKRETLANALFENNGALSNLSAKRSEVYLLRGRNPSIAYHLDAQNVSRILVAAKTELRPNDIIFVAERPIISFARTLSEILPLRILLKDIKNDNIP